MTRHRYDVPALARTLSLDRPTAPRLTWYGPGGERVELSGRVLANWVVKAGNLLVDECDAAPGTRVCLDLPVHWRWAVWLLATWSVGACGVLDRPTGTVEDPNAGTAEGPATGTAAGPAADPLCDVLVSTRPGAMSGTGPQSVLAVALPALATAFPGSLPEGVIDATGAVRAQPDHPGYRPEIRADAAALAIEGAVSVLHGQLSDAVERAVTGAGWTAPVRLLCVDPAPADAISWLLAPLLHGGSVVLVSAQAQEAEDLPRLTATEAVTATY